MRILLQKNLIAHKQRNFLTSIIYSLALGCIIFLLVTCNLQLQTIIAQDTISGVDIALNSNGFYANATDQVLRKWDDKIKDFGYWGANVATYRNRKGAEIYFGDLENKEHVGKTVYPIGPSSLFDSSFYDVGYDYDSWKTSLPASEQLYTARGT